MRLSRLLGLRKFLVHLPSRVVPKKAENFSISCVNWYNFCELRKFSVCIATMSIENSVVGGSTDSEIKTMNGLNGVSNGHSVVSSGSLEKKEKSKHNSSSSHHHKSSSKDKHRDKDREHKSSKTSHSSSSKDKHHSSSSRHDKDKSSSDKHKSSSDKDKHKSSSSSKHHSGSSSGKDKHRDKDRERDHKSSKSSHSHSSSSKDKHHSSSSSSRHDKSKSSTDKDKDKHRSSSSKHHSGSSSGKDKHRDKEHREHRDKDKHSSKSSHDRHKAEKKASENGVSHIKAEPVAVINEELRDPLDTANFSFSETNAIQANGIRDCFVNVSQISETSSCDYSMSQFRADESAFSIKEEAPEVDDDGEEIASFGVFRNETLDSQDDEDVPIAQRTKKIKREITDDEDEMPLTARKKPKTEKKEKKIKREPSDDEEDDYDKPKKKKIKKEKKVKEEIKTESASPQKGRKKKEGETQEVWKWWEEEKPKDGTKWSYLEHKGPVFAPDYEPLPQHVVFEYDGHPMKLSQDAEEIAGFYARMLEHDYTSKDIFNNNFFKDWRKSMTSKEKEKITRLEKCNFRKMAAYFTELSERNKNRTKEEKLALKEENEKLINEYGFCTIDGHKEKIGNFKIEPPGLFRGRGEHPKMGLVKKRIMPEDVMINCSKNSKIPVPPKGHRWKEVRHDNTVTWLASWTENVQGQVKYVMLNPSSKLKGEKDWQKYETARRLHKHIEKIRSTYREEWKSKEMRIRQRAVALYFIDKLALRAGNEKDEDQADTVGCCSLRVEHIELHKELNGKENVVVFDFLGKDSIRYYNEVEVEKRVFKNLELFKENKKDGDDLFDRLNTVVMNEHLRDLMDGLTAKVFRTYNASWTLQNQLQQMTDPNASIPEKLLAYNRANRAVAILCNHQRAVPKGHQKSMENLKEKIRAKRDQIDDLEVDVKDCVKAAKRGSVKEKVIADKKKKQLEKLKEQLKKLELQETDRDENKTIALGTSKLNYLDPRISVAWCKKHGVPIEKIYNKTQRDKFRWAIDMADEDYEF